MSSSSSSSTRNVFDQGKFNTVLQKVESAEMKSCTKKKSDHLVEIYSPPKPLLIGMPCEAGEFPVLIHLHGYLLYNSFYSQLIHHIASHGFIVIAPQLYEVAGPDSSEEITSTAAITNWLPKGLSHFLPPHIHPNLNKLALAGHSRGAKTSFALSLTKPSPTNLKFSALIAIDPVDGMDKNKQTPPPVLTYVPHSFDLNYNIPSLVIGSALGEVKRNPFFPPCAPNGVNHRDFFRECRKPAFYFVAKDYGHLDILDDETSGIRGRASYCLCKNGKSREPMRRFVGGLGVGFLKAYLCGEDGDFRAIEDGVVDMPVELETIDFLL